ncbi:MAG: hypothetical protein FGM24_05245 [Candidatus Kapabacteria bacterium]|nr:hypothetical protein [Candidatus Kapabacteria bacterium]
MARIQQTIDTSKSIVEMRTLIDTKVLGRPEISLLIEQHHWDGNVLHASGKLGKGTITLEHQRVVIDIELSMFGSVAKGAIEQQLNDQIKRIAGGK